jgi:hypothetical protein
VSVGSLRYGGQLGCVVTPKGSVGCRTLGNLKSIPDVSTVRAKGPQPSKWNQGNSDIGYARQTELALQDEAPSNAGQFDLGEGARSDPGPSTQPAPRNGNRFSHLLVPQSYFQCTLPVLDVWGMAVC